MSAHVSWKELSEAYAFVGNSLLKPMTQTSDIGLDPAFWEAFPTFGSPDVAGACAALAAYARAAREAAASDGCDPVERCAVEYTRLFVGPPSPAAPPWETFHHGAADGFAGGVAGAASAEASAEGAGGAKDAADAESGRREATVGFGRATFDMRRRLREAGLEVRNENNQYEDHLGIEMLLLSALCARAAALGGAGGESPSAGNAAGPSAAASFVEAHPLMWLPSLRAAVEKAAPGGYFSRLLVLTDALLRVPLDAFA